MLEGTTGQILWQQPISGGKLIQGEFPNFIYQGKLIVLGNQFSTGKSTVYAFDALTGREIWKWSDWFLSDRLILLDNLYAFNDVLIVSNGPFNYGIRVSDGQTLWNSTAPNRELSGNLGATGFGNK